MTEYSGLTIILPTLNESQNIGPLLEELRARYKHARIIVVDDGSIDGTRQIVERIHKHDEYTTLLDRSAEEIAGLTASVLDGIKATTTDYFIVMDGDFQHPPETIKEIYPLLKKHEIVIAERSKVMIKWPLHRKLMSQLATLLGNTRLMFKGFGWRDIMSGYFGASTAHVKLLIMDYPRDFYLGGYKVLFDILKLTPTWTSIGAVKYVFGARKGGTSKIGWRHIKIYMKSLLS